MAKNKSILINFIFAWLISLTMLGGDYLFALLEPRYLLVLNTKRLVGYFLFNFFLSFIVTRWSRRNFYPIALFLSFIQMAHISYFGTLILPHEYLLFFYQYGEISNASSDWLPVIIKPAMICLSSGVMIFALHFIWAERLRGSKLGLVLFILVLASGPFQIIFRGSPFGERSNSHATTFYNSYATISFFLFKLAPDLLIKSIPIGEVSPAPKKLRETQEHVIFVLGESLGINNLSLYGYPKATTPRLKALKEKKELIAKKLVSCAVSSDVSLPMIFHSQCSITAMPQIISANSCLFALAKKSGFVTRFHSGQPADEMKGIHQYLCPRYIDHYSDAYDLVDDYKVQINDLQLLDFVDQINWDLKQFVVLHMRSPHTPYQKNYPQELEVFKKQKSESWAKKK